MSKKPRGLSTPFVSHSLALLESPAWKLQTATLRKIIERLEVEHLRHAGTANGQLFVSYGQFVQEGISRRSIKPAFRLGQKLGLVDISRLARPSNSTIRPPQAYRLIYLSTRSASPNNEWERASALHIAQAALTKSSAKETLHS
jgi:hypothetical protein